MTNTISPTEPPASRHLPPPHHARQTAARAAWVVGLVGGRRPGVGHVHAGPSASPSRPGSPSCCRRSCPSPSCRSTPSRWWPWCARSGSWAQPAWCWRSCTSLLSTPRSGHHSLPAWAATAPRLTVFEANVYDQNAEPDAAARKILASGADVLVLVEMDSSMLRSLRQQGIDQTYPYSTSTSGGPRRRHLVEAAAGGRARGDRPHRHAVGHRRARRSPAPDPGRPRRKRHP